MRRQRHPQLLLQLGGDGALQKLWQTSRLVGRRDASQAGCRVRVGTAARSGRADHLAAACADNTQLPSAQPPACVSVSKSTVRSRVRSRCCTMRASAVMPGGAQSGVASNWRARVRATPPASKIGGSGGGRRRRQLSAVGGPFRRRSRLPPSLAAHQRVLRSSRSTGEVGAAGACHRRCLRPQQATSTLGDHFLWLGCAVDSSNWGAPAEHLHGPRHSATPVRPSPLHRCTDAISYHSQAPAPCLSCPRCGPLAKANSSLFHLSDDSQCCGARSCGWVWGNERSAACPASRCHCLPAADARRLRARVAWRSAHVWASASWRPSLLMTRVSQILESLQCCAPPDASSPQSESRSRRHPSLMLAPVAHASTWYMTCLSH